MSKQHPNLHVIVDLLGSCPYIIIDTVLSSFLILMLHFMHGIVCMFLLISEAKVSESELEVGVDQPEDGSPTFPCNQSDLLISPLTQ